MSSGFSGGGSDFFAAGGPGRANMNNNVNLQQQLSYRSPLGGILPEPASQIMPSRRPDLIGKRSLADYQQQNQYGLGFYLRNVKPRPNYQHASPVSPLSLVDFSPVSTISPEVASVSNSPSINRNPRYGVPILHQLRPQSSFPNLVQNGAGVGRNAGIVSGPECFSTQESEKKMMNHRLQELEKELLGDEDEGEAVSVVTNSEWSETIQNLINPTQKPISPSPSSSSSSSSCASTSASPPLPCPKQSMIDAAGAISEGKTEIAMEILTRLRQVANPKGTLEQKLAAYLSTALMSRVNPSDHPPAASELYTKEHVVTTHLLYNSSPCFKLGFMAANLAILKATSDQAFNKLHVLDFDIGQGGQYVHLIHAAAKNGGNKPAVLKITTFTDFSTGGEERLKMVGEVLKALASKNGIYFSFSILNLTASELTREKLAVESDEALAVNFAFKLHQLPDESVTTENLRDELLRRVKGLSPNVVMLVEQEMNANTAPLVARVKEACEYYGALFDSLEATLSRDDSDRVRIEEGLGRRMSNSVACEGRDRVERCEVFGKWRARLSMAGFQPQPVSQPVAELLRCKLNSGTRGNPGFTVNELCGGISFGWMGRTLTVASAWR